MAAPLFDQSEIDAILGCEKYLSEEARKKRARYTTVGGVRQRKVELQLLSDLPWPLEVYFDETISDVRSEVTFALLADVDNRGREMICRYDIQANEHENPKWSDGKLLKPYEPHKHVYRPESIKFGDLTCLRVASPIRIKGAQTFETKSECLFRIFCSELKIAIDKDIQLRFWP